MADVLIRNTWICLIFPFLCYFMGKAYIEPVSFTFGWIFVLLPIVARYLDLKDTLCEDAKSDLKIFVSQIFGGSIIMCSYGGLGIYMALILLSLVAFVVLLALLDKLQPAKT